MPIRRQVCAWVAVCSVAPALGLAQERTERDLLELMAREGPRAQVIRAESEALRHEQLARLTYPNPGVQYSREGAGFTEFLQVEQPLPLFGMRSSLSKAGVAAIAAAEADRDARLWALRADDAAAVARLIAEQDRLLAAEAHEARVERLIDVLHTREREGEGSRFDRLRAEQELRDARQSSTAAGVARAEARSAVSTLLPRGAALDRVVRTEGSARTAPPLEGLLARASSARAELLALQHAGERADREGNVARRSRLPSPTVFGGLKRADTVSGTERGGVFGLSLAIPLFDTGGRDAARWTAERARIDAERAALENAIRAEITRASEALALRQRAVLEDEPASGDELTRVAEVAYREGEVGILELLDAIRTASRATTRSIDNHLEARLAQIALERAVGEPLWP